MSTKINWDKPICERIKKLPARLLCRDFKNYKRDYPYLVAITDIDGNEIPISCNGDGEPSQSWIDFKIMNDYSRIPTPPPPSRQKDETLSSMTFPGLGLQAAAGLLKHSYAEREARRLNEKARLIRSRAFGLRERESDLFWREKNLKILESCFGLRGIYLEAHAALIATSELNQDMAALCASIISKLDAEAKSLREQINAEEIGLS